MAKSAPGPRGARSTRRLSGCWRGTCADPGHRATSRGHAWDAETPSSADRILLTKAPSTSEDELIPWLKTVVKHEAWALRRQRERHSPVTDDGELRDRPAPTSVTHEQAERLERLRLGAEALGHLKPHEVRALRLKAEGFSYREICAMTGWSYTKVNRLLTEGRRAFLRRVSGSSAAPSARATSRCSRRWRTARRARRTCAPAPAHADLPELPRPPARVPRAPERVATWCRRRRSWRADGGGPLRSLVESLVGASERFHAAAELATGQKVAAVAASAAALAGGGPRSTSSRTTTARRCPTRSNRSSRPR